MIETNKDPERGKAVELYSAGPQFESRRKRHQIFRGSLSFAQVNIDILPQIRPLSLPSQSFPIHYSLSYIRIRHSSHNPQSATLALNYIVIKLHCHKLTNKETRQPV